MAVRVLALTMVFLAVSATPRVQAEGEKAVDSARESIIRKVMQIQRADYEGDRGALKRLHEELTVPAGDKTLASRVLYWRGFAMWRRAINGFNETPTPTDLEDDLNQAIADFRDSLAHDPKYVESKIAEASCLGYVMYLHRSDQSRVQELIQQSSPLLKDAMASDPDNPRLLWVLGPIRWSSPPERGGGQDKAIELYNRGLDIVRKQKPATDPLEPSWGEPELLMNRAWSNLNRTTPELTAAQQDADAVLKIVPYWHYVRDILVPQIQQAKAKAKTP